MASSNSPSLLFLIILVSILCSLHSTTASFSAIFSFGDSHSDNGNLLHIIGKDKLHISKPPYGATYFGHPNGRFCDGRLVIDFIAEAMGLPFLPPYLDGQINDDFKNGVNFAVAGVTAMENEFFKSRGVKVSWTNMSLWTQMHWFKQLLPSLCSYPLDCEDLLKRSLFIVGEIGGNDYIFFLMQGRTIKEIEPLLPIVVGNISLAVEELIKLGARTLVIPGNLPIGCNSVFLTQYQSNDTKNYDQQSGCIKWLNDLAMLHNSRLQQEILNLQILHPNATIIYADYYGAAMNIITNPRQFGFGEALSACCGGHGPYNFNFSQHCGRNGKILCDDPSKYVVWDGIHMTEAANSVIASAFLRGPYATIPKFDTCPSDEQIGFI